MILGGIQYDWEFTVAARDQTVAVGFDYILHALEAGTWSRTQFQAYAQMVVPYPEPRRTDFFTFTVLCIDGAVADALRESLKDGLKDGSILHWDERSI